MTHEWQVLNNQFLNETSDSYKKALKLSKHHDSALNVVCHALRPLPSAARSSGKQIQPVEGHGGVIICTTGLPASPCAAGYQLTSGTTFKDKISALGIDLNLQNIQFTNPGLDTVVVRAGAKINQ